MKRLANVLKKVGIVSIILLSLSISSKALSSHNYCFHFPSYLSNSMWYSSIESVTGGSPYVYPGVSTISTKYFFSPYQSGWTQATEVATIGNRTKYTFTWRSGYGGSGHSYCLAGCPDAANGSWPAYDAYGIFAE